MTALQIVLALFLALLSLLVLYLLFLAAVFFFSGTTEKIPGRRPKLKFAVIIPAHNEAAGISGTLDSLRDVDYPSCLYDVVVVADNCTDATAEVARAGGSRCMERNYDARRGKGYALAYATGALMGKGYDAFIIVDADSVLSRNFLALMNDRLMSGQKAVQAYYGVANPEASPLTYFFFIGNGIENNLFYSAKSRLGLPVFLRGNGMCFAREVFEEQPWDSYSIVEDIEYGIRLVRNGVPVHFEQRAKVLARQPESIRQAYSQRVRWASGNIGISKVYAFTLMLKGASERDMVLFDAGLSLLVLSKPLLLLLSLSALAGSVLYSLSDAGHGAAYVLWAGSLLAAQGGYLSAGILMESLNRKRVLYLLSAPFYMAWLFFVTVLGLAGHRRDLWVRTKR